MHDGQYLHRRTEFHGRHQSRNTALLAGIVLVAGALRLFQASHHPFTSDELLNIAVVDAIRFSIVDPHLVLSGPDHPLLNVYLAHIGTILLGKTLLGYRIANVILGTLTCWAVYTLGREVWPRTAGLWAAALLAVDQFHTTLSGALNSNDVGAILFGTLSMICCVRLTRSTTIAPFLGLGFWLGLAYLSKETALLIAPVPWLFVLSSHARRPILRDWRWYAAHLVFLIVIAPDLWSIFTTGGWLHLSSTKALDGNASLIQGKAVSLFLGEIVMWIKPNILGGPADYWCWPLRTVHWVGGVLYLGSVIWAWRHWRKPEVFAVQLFFWIVVLAVSVIPGEEVWDPFWWASMAISPAVVLAGGLLDDVTQASRKTTWLGVVLMAWLLGRTFSQQMTTYCYPGAVPGTTAAIHTSRV